VVSFPSFELFEDQPESYRHQVLPPAVTARVAIEAGVRQCWDRYLGFSGRFIGMEGFGASAPFAEIYTHRGITVDAIVSAAKALAG
jgi:transketolase